MNPTREEVERLCRWMQATAVRYRHRQSVKVIPWNRQTLDYKEMLRHIARGILSGKYKKARKEKTNG